MCPVTTTSVNANVNRDRDGDENTSTRAWDASDTSWALWYVFLIIDYEYWTRGLKTRFDASRASLIYVPSYHHHHVDECESEHGQGWGQTKTQGRGWSPRYIFFCVFPFTFTDDYLQIYYMNGPRYKDKGLGMRQNTSRGSLLPPFLSPKKKNLGHVKTCLKVLSFLPMRTRGSRCVNTCLVHVYIYIFLVLIPTCNYL